MDMVWVQSILLLSVNVPSDRKLDAQNKFESRKRHLNTMSSFLCSFPLFHAFFPPLLDYYCIFQQRNKTFWVYKADSHFHSRPKMFAASQLAATCKCHSLTTTAQFLAYRLDVASPYCCI